MAPHPAVAEVRRAVREHLRRLGQGRALVACSGGADSLALAAATAFVAGAITFVISHDRVAPVIVAAAVFLPAFWIFRQVFMRRTGGAGFRR
jgi:hypothetical protein